MSIYEFIKDRFSEHSIIFEIGCHMGLDTKKIIETTKSNNIYCFECDPRNIEILKNQNFNITINETAISDIDGRVNFYQSTGKPGVSFGDRLLDDNDWSASSSIKKPKEHLNETPWCKFMNPINVKSTRIDTYCEQEKINSIDFVWMDVQGAEREVLSGFGKILSKTNFIYTEYSNKELYENSIMTKNDIIELLGDNWVVIYDFGSDLLLENRAYCQ